MVKYGYQEDLEKEERRNKYIALVITLVVHLLVLVCFIFLGLTHQVPPPPEYGIEVDMGGGGGGGAAVRSQISTEKKQSAPQERLLTQDQEETTMLNANKQQTTNNKPKVTSTPQPTTTPTEPTPTVNENALFKKSANGGGGTGSGSGSGIGSGTGTGTGSGSGAGIGDSNGDFQLDGRPVVAKAFPNAKNNLDGIVKVEFRADRDGNVVYAKAGIRGTTINDPKTWEECEKAAYRSKFKAKPDADAEERGTITYRFVLQ